MSVSDYTAKIKSICYSLCSINVKIDEDEMVQVCLGGLAQRFNPLRTTILARENPPSFFNHQCYWSKKTMSKQGPTRGKDKCSSLIRIGAEDEVEAEEVDSTYPTKGTQNFGKNSHRGTFARRGSFHAEQGRQTTPPTCNYCGKIDNREEECRKRRSESASTTKVASSRKMADP